MRFIALLARIFGKRVEWQEPIPHVSYLWRGKFYHPLDWQGEKAHVEPDA